MNSCVINVPEHGIQEMFKHYVSSTEGKQRHTAAADQEVGMFSAYCSGAFGGNTRIQNSLYERMMSCAVEFEESGFIAGFRWAAKLLAGEHDAETTIAVAEPLPEFSAEKVDNPSAEPEKMEPAVMTEEKSVPEKPHIDAIQDCITSKQIAEMFGTSNWKVVRRIEKMIFPYLDEESKKFFEKTECFNTQHKVTVIYKLNRAACMIYYKEVERRKNNHTTIAAGCVKMQELMERVFKTERVMTPVT